MLNINKQFATTTYKKSEVKTCNTQLEYLPNVKRVSLFFTKSTSEDGHKTFITSINVIVPVICPS